MDKIARQIKVLSYIPDVGNCKVHACYPFRLVSETDNVAWSYGLDCSVTLVFKDALVVDIMFGFVVMRIPNLRKEGIKLGLLVIVPRQGETFRTPVSSQNFRQRIEVIDANLDWIARTSPMNRGVSTTWLSHSTDINEFDTVWMGLRLDGFDNVFNGCDIHFKRTFRVIIGCRRDHSSHMKHDICTLNTSQHVIIDGEISVNYVYTFHFFHKVR